jgi:hypothetical protein
MSGAERFRFTWRAKFVLGIGLAVWCLQTIGFDFGPAFAITVRLRASRGISIEEPGLSR